MNEIIVVCLFFIVIELYAFYFLYVKHKILQDWLKEHAPMTWETYKRLGKCKKN
jgi:uncharacterized protein YneF (UPF0154 family)